MTIQVPQITFNRTILELKLDILYTQKSMEYTFNRTILELKLEKTLDTSNGSSTFNRTILELKQPENSSRSFPAPVF